MFWYVKIPVFESFVLRDISENCPSICRNFIWFDYNSFTSCTYLSNLKVKATLIIQNNVLSPVNHLGKYILVGWLHMTGISWNGIRNLTSEKILGCMIWKLSLSLLKGCVTEDSNVPLVGFFNCTRRDQSGHFLILLSRDKSYLTFQKMHFPPFFVSNPKEFSREVRLSLHQMSRTHSDWWMTLANSLWVSPYFDWVVVVKSGEQ